MEDNQLRCLSIIVCTICFVMSVIQAIGWHMDRKKQSDDESNDDGPQGDGLYS